MTELETPQANIAKQEADIARTRAALKACDHADEWWLEIELKLRLQELDDMYWQLRKERGEEGWEVGH